MEVFVTAMVEYTPSLYDCEEMTYMYKNLIVYLRSI